MIAKSTRIAYSEIDTFLSLLDENTRNKVPEKLLQLFKNEKDPKYIKHIDPNVPIENQNLQKETLALIAFLYLNYWCNNEKEKQELKKMYDENDKKQNDEMWKKLET